MQPAAPRVYSYIRFSDARQAIGASAERQAAYAARWAAEHGMVLDEQLTLRDEGLSAYHQRHVSRGALGVFLAAVEAGQVPRDSVLVVEGLDRLSRAEPIQAQAQMANIVNAGITVVTASDGKAYSRERLRANPMDLIHSLLVMIRAHEESATKSSRVRDAIRRQIQGWQAGTYRGLIRYGQTPGWLRVVDGAWQLIPGRVDAIKYAIARCLDGIGTVRIARELHDRQMSCSDGTPTSGHLTRLLAHPALRGEKHLLLDGETHVLAGYYPAVLDADAWTSLQDTLASRARRTAKGDIPSVLTGLGITRCGYCGQPLKAQTMVSHRRADGWLPDGQRRLQCVAVNAGARCPVPGSCSAATVERAIVEWCSHLVNLQRLVRGDAAALPRAELASAREQLADVEARLARITEALEVDGDTPPATILRRARELETERSRLEHQVQDAERAVATAARADTVGADERWRAVAAGVMSLDYDARMQARQLVADTFASIAVWRRGIDPSTTPDGVMDVTLTSRTGVSRLLRITRQGELLADDEWV